MKNLGIYDENLDVPRKQDVDVKYGPTNQPPYPVTSVNGQTGDVTVKAELPANLVKYKTLGKVEPTQSIDATTFQGKNIDYFATKVQINEVNNQISNVKTTAENAQKSADTAQENINKLSSQSVPKTGTTMTGPLIAESNEKYTVAQMRNIILSTSEPTNTQGNNGDIWIVYGG